MAKRIKRDCKQRASRRAQARRKTRPHRIRQPRIKPNRRRRRKLISDVRLEQALRVYSRTKDIDAAARSIRVSRQTLERAAIKRLLRHKRPSRLRVAIRRLPRRMPIFSGGKQLAITVNSKSAAMIGRYNSAVRQFLGTNDPKFLAEFKGRGVKDARGKLHPFETDPNTLYRLSSAGSEPFEEIYRIVL